MPVDPARNASITALIVAQDAFQDKRDRSHIIGVFDTIGSSKFPFNVAFTVYCRIQGTGMHTAYIKVEDSLEEKIIETEPLACEVSVTKGHEWFAGFGMTFKAPGLYKVKAFLDGVLEQEVPLMVRRTAAAEPE